MEGHIYEGVRWSKKKMTEQDEGERRINMKKQDEDECAR